jgi:hypothetical protein
MVKKIFIVAISLTSFVGYSQEDTSVVDLSILFPKLFSGCKDSSAVNTKKFFIPLSTDYEAIGFFNDAVSATYSKGVYQAGVLDLNRTTKFVSDVWVEVADGENVIVLPLCEINQAYVNGVLFSEYEKVFDFLYEKTKEFEK